MIVVVFFGADASASMVTVRARDHARTELLVRLRPAQAAVGALTKSLIDQDSGVRGFALTGEPSFLDPYTAGRATEATLVTGLRSDLSGHPRALDQLVAALVAADDWDARAAMPLIAARRSGQVATSELLADADLGKQLFDTVRARLESLTEEVAAAVADQSAKGNVAGNRLELIISVTLGLIAIMATGVFLAIHRFITKPIAVLGDSVVAAGAGNLADPISIVGPSELARLASAVEQMRCRLLDQAHDTLQESLILAQDSERRRIAQDIHDDSVQSLTVVTLRLQRLAKRIKDPEDLDVVRGAQQAASEAIDRLRVLMFQLHPPNLEGDGLAEAVRLYLSETLNELGVHCDLRNDIDVEPSRPVQLLAYRLVCEALLNVAKHAHAAHVAVTLAARQGGVRATVADDGIGFDIAGIVERPGHLGLTTMAAMADAAGGWWTVVSRPGAGAKIDFWLPDQRVSP